MPKFVKTENKMDHTTYNYKGLKTINLQTVNFTENKRQVRAYTVEKRPTYIIKNNIAPAVCEPKFTT